MYQPGINNNIIQVTSEQYMQINAKAGKDKENKQRKKKTL